MPLCRYFVFVGGLLLALLLLIDRYAPQTAIEATAPSVDRAAIRIHSAHKWPSAVVFDTTQPTVAPVLPALAEVAPAGSAPGSTREAIAMARDSDVTPAAVAAPRTQAKRVRHATRVARTPAARVASYDAFAFRPFFQSGW